jgi:hypothetical protein
MDHFADEFVDTNPITRLGQATTRVRQGDHILVSAPDGAAHLYVYRQDPISVAPLSAVNIQVG